MSEPSVCPACGSDRVAVKDSRPQVEATYRRRACRECGHRYSTSSRSTTIAGVTVTMEATASTKHASKLRLNRIWRQLMAMAHNF